MFRLSPCGLVGSGFSLPEASLVRKSALVDKVAQNRTLKSILPCTAQLFASPTRRATTHLSLTFSLNSTQAALTRTSCSDKLRQSQLAQSESAKALLSHHMDKCCVSYVFPVGRLQKALFIFCIIFVVPPHPGSLHGPSGRGPLAPPRYRKEEGSP